MKTKELISLENSKWIRHHIAKNKATFKIEIKKKMATANVLIETKNDIYYARGMSDNGLNHAIEKCRKDFNRQFDINTIY